MCTQPGGGPTSWRWQGKEPEGIQSIQLDLSTSLLRHTATEAGFDTDHFELLEGTGLEAPLFHQLGQSLAATLRGQGPDDALYVDTVAQMLATQLVYQHSTQPRPMPVYRGSLSPERLRLIEDYVRDSLQQVITLASLASLACVSPYHFCRIFKQATAHGEMV